MKTRKLHNLTVSEVGMGCMAFAYGYGQIPSEQYGVKAIRNRFRAHSASRGCSSVDGTGAAPGPASRNAHWFRWRIGGWQSGSPARTSLWVAGDFL